MFGYFYPPGGLYLAPQVISYDAGFRYYAPVLPQSLPTMAILPPNYSTFQPQLGPVTSIQLSTLEQDGGIAHLSRLAPLKKEQPAPQPINNTQQGQPPDITPTIRTRYSKKNSESNIARQAASFITSPRKCSKILWRVLQKGRKLDETEINQLCMVFYSYGRGVRRFLEKRHITRKTLLTLSCQTPEFFLTEYMREPSDTEKLPVEEYCWLNRVLLRYYLRNLSQLTVIASKKLVKDSRKEHFRRRRQILDWLMENWAHMATENKEQ